MPDEKQPETIKLVAVERGFAMGRMIHPGEKFDFARLDSKGNVRKLPKWAQLANIPLPEKPKVADLKPKAAQDAVKTKRGQLAGDLA
jgi:hypothetical protein